MTISIARCALRVFAAATVAAAVFLATGPEAGPTRAWAQVEAVAPPPPPPQRAKGGGIFIGRPKAAGETLDDSPKAAPGAATGDTAVTVQGDRLHGTVVAAEQDGKLRLTAPQFESEVQVLVSALDSVSLSGSDKEPGGDEVILANGDRIAGELAAIDADAVQIETKAAGRLKISLRVVRTVAIGRGASILVESNFASGAMEPWINRGGAWSLADGVLVCRNRGSSNSGAIYVKLDQTEAVTLVAKVQATEGMPFTCYAAVFADTSEGNPNSGRFGRNSLMAMFQQSEFYLNSVQDGSSNQIANKSFGRSIQQGTIRLAYDPATAKARVWLDATELGQYDVPGKLTRGQYVIFNSQYSSKIEQLAVLRGVVAPGGDDLSSGGPAVDATVVEFANKDRVSVTALNLAEGQFTCVGPYGELKCPIANVGRVQFGKKDQEGPRRQKNDVRVTLTSGRLTLQFDRLTADALVGRSPYLGEVKLRRSAVKEIKFNLYR